MERTGESNSALGGWGLTPVVHVPFPTGLSGRYPGVSSLMPREESRDPPSAKSSVRPNAHLCVHIIPLIQCTYMYVILLLHVCWLQTIGSL